MTARVLRIRPLVYLVMLMLALAVEGSSHVGAATATATDATATKTLRIAITQAAPDPFDPPLVFTNASIGLAQNVFDGLTTLSLSNGQARPDIAKSWKVSKEGLVYTFKLRQNARFQNGKRITASDLVYSFNRAIAPKTAAPLGFYFQSVKGYDDVISGKATSAAFSAPNKSTLRIVLSKPQGNFLAVLSRQPAWAVNQAVVDRFGNSWVNPPNVLGTGPYRLVGRTGNTKFVFQANPRYWGAKPKIKRVEVTVIQDPTAAVARYQSGEFDAVDGLTGPSVLQARADKKLSKQLHSVPLARTDWLGMRTDRPPFNKKNVRLAFSHAINKQQLVRIAMQNQASVAKDWIPPSVGGSIQKTWKGYAYNPALAKRELAAAGYPNGQGFPEISLYYTTQFAGIVEQSMELIQQQLESNLGVHVSLRDFPRPSFVATIQNPNERPAIWAWTFGYDIPDASTTTSFFGLSGAPLNFEVWSNKTYDSLVNKALVTSNDAQRSKLFAKSERIRMNAAVVIPLYFPNQTWLVNPRVKGFGYANAVMKPFNVMALK